MLDGKLPLQLIRGDDRRPAVSPSWDLVAVDGLDTIGLHESGDPVLATALPDVPKVQVHAAVAVGPMAGGIGGTDQY